MKLYRFMSTYECCKLFKGETLVSSTDHSSVRGSASTAKGFCFGIGDEEQAKNDFRRLKGIVDLGALMVFTVKPESESRFSACIGRYVDYDKINSEGKTVDDYPLGLVPSCMVIEYCTNSYSLKDFENFYVYHTSINTDKGTSDNDFLVMRELGNLPVDVIEEQDFDKGREVANEIVRLINSQDINAGQTMIAFSIAVSSFIDTVVEQSEFSRDRCFDDFVNMLESFVFPEGENQ